MWIYSLITFSIKFHFCFVFWQVYFEVHILEHLPAEFGDDHQETDPHVVRVGWSIDSSSFQLGMYIFLAATTTWTSFVLQTFLDSCRRIS